MMAASANRRHTLIMVPFAFNLASTLTLFPAGRHEAQTQLHSHAGWVPAASAPAQLEPEYVSHEAWHHPEVLSPRDARASKIRAPRYSRVS
jgi:hypothetical protein